MQVYECPYCYQVSKFKGKKIYVSCFYKQKMFVVEENGHVRKID